MTLLPYLIAAILVACVLLFCLFIVASDRSRRETMIATLRNENAQLSNELTKARAPTRWTRS
jgi:hypothetical protein